MNGSKVCEYSGQRLAAGKQRLTAFGMCVCSAPRTEAARLGLPGQLVDADRVIGGEHADADVHGILLCRWGLGPRPRRSSCPGDLGTPRYRRRAVGLSLEDDTCSAPCIGRAPSLCWFGPVGGIRAADRPPINETVSGRKAETIQLGASTISLILSRRPRCRGRRPLRGRGRARAPGGRSCSGWPAGRRRRGRGRARWWRSTGRGWSRGREARGCAGRFRLAAVAQGSKRRVTRGTSHGRVPLRCRSGSCAIPTERALPTHWQVERRPRRSCFTSMLPFLRGGMAVPAGSSSAVPIPWKA
jgi:hypothetical protein